MNEVQSVNLKDFNIIERLGKGSFGSVYLVEKKSDAGIYAMKVLEKEKILKQNLVRYAMTERNVLCLAKHPFIVSLNYAFQTTNKLYLIVDYCPGGDMGMALSK
jgi:serine/threonine protein kinase